MSSVTASGHLRGEPAEASMWQISAYCVLDRMIVSVAYYHADRVEGQRWEAFATKEIDTSHLAPSDWTDELALIAEELLDVAYDR